MTLRIVDRINLYLSFTIAYGFAHALPRAYKLKREYVPDKHVDALVTDKAAYCCHAASISPIVWPWYLARDMRTVELVARGKRAEEYPEKWIS
jgi:hypothetical protein